MNVRNGCTGSSAFDGNPPSRVTIGVIWSPVRPLPCRVDWPIEPDVNRVGWRRIKSRARTTVCRAAWREAETGGPVVAAVRISAAADTPSGIVVATRRNRRRHHRRRESFNGEQQVALLAVRSRAA